MLMLLASAQIDRRAVAVLDMQADGLFVEFASRTQIHHVKHGVAASDHVEGRIVDVLRNGHQQSQFDISRLYPCTASGFKASWILLRFQLVSLSLICMSNERANGLCAKTGSR